MDEESVCPECGKTAHNPKTGYCWLSRSRNTSKGVHCSHCCVTTQRVAEPRK